MIPLFDAVSTNLEASESISPDALFQIAQHLYRDLPVDNIIPASLANAALKDTYTSPLIGDWLGSDRPPLQSGLIIFSSIATRGLGFDWNSSLFAASIVANSMWILGGLTFVSTLQFKQNLIYASVLPAGLSGYIILNTTFTWPKALAAAFLLASISSICTNQNPSYLRIRSCLSGLLLGFACLSHGSSFFAVPAVMIVGLLHNKRNVRQFSLQPLQATLLLLLSFVSVQTPWIFWQKFIDPPGDRLLKWHLAGAINITPDSFMHVLLAQYRSLDFSSIVQNKISNFKLLFGNGDSLVSWKDIFAGQYQSAIDTEFFFQSVAILTWILPTALMALALLVIKKRMLVTTNLNSSALLISSLIFFATTIFWCLAMFGPSTTVNHQGTGLTIVMALLMSGTIFANINFLLFFAGCCIQAVAVFALYTHEISIPAKLAFILCETLILCGSILIKNIHPERLASKSSKRDFSQVL
ncbi:hypothetical protein KBY79_08515 [Synechococcus lacustris C3-12m-Tous]|uniref:hypothetical protein n=1 Tax=Synechococcus lacustris TaxID=2116544 RepID=UPI0020CBAABF|nr:hypothetical protein [Synechococcus lacustris]MCP9925252.1 hypothetical protein [Synechococcus lacustris C3-12m-Tous]